MHDEGMEGLDFRQVFPNFVAFYKNGKKFSCGYLCIISIRGTETL
jgi:hypothetical protein